MSLYSDHAVPRMTSFSILPQQQLFNVEQPRQDPKKRHSCPTCSRAFTTSGHLARHIRVHTGERNHKCPFPGCETRCSRQDNLQQHYRIHLSPGSRRASSRRADRKKSNLSSTTTPDTTPSPAASTIPTQDLRAPSPPDAPPPLARAPLLPYSSAASGSGSSASSPRTSPGASPYSNVLGLSHERTQSPSSYFSDPQADLYTTYPSSSSSNAPTLPPIHALQTGFHTGTSGGLGLARVPAQHTVHQSQSATQVQHPGPYPTFDMSTSTSHWTPHDSFSPTTFQSTPAWWNNVPVTRGYAQGFAN